MSYFVKAVCSRCGSDFEGHFYDACPHCAAEGVNANWKTIYDLKDAKLPGKDCKEPGIFRYRQFMPIGDNDPVVSLNEGNTKVRHLKNLGARLGVPNLYVKDESGNPTWSQKDRLAAVMVSRALAAGAPGMTCSSTGNQAASTAAYCAVAGLPCIVFTSQNVSREMKTLMQAYGAYVFVTPTLPDRVKIMKQVVSKLGYVPASGIPKPPIGSDGFSLDGYKTIAFELYEQFGGKLPDWVVFSISYGGTLEGTYRGFCDLKAMGYIDKIPKIAAAERYGPAMHTIEAGQDDPIAQHADAPSCLTSMATEMVAYHTIQAIKDSGGVARTVTDEETIAMHKVLAQTEGLFSEVSSVPPLVIIEKMKKEGLIQEDETVCYVSTSTGLKGLEIAESWLPELPLIEPTMEDFKASMKKNYGKDI